MGYEVRRVARRWKHPKDRAGNYIQLYCCYNDAVSWYQQRKKAWLDEGIVLSGDLRHHQSRRPLEESEERSEAGFIAHVGDFPLQKDHMPSWGYTYRTHFQVYNVELGGIPVSPVVAAIPDLAPYLNTTMAMHFTGTDQMCGSWVAIRIGDYIDPVYRIV